MGFGFWVSFASAGMFCGMHPPMIIFVLLFTLGLGCSFMAGYSVAGAKVRSWSHTIGFELSQQQPSM